MSHGWSWTENADPGCGMKVLHHDHTAVDVRRPETAHIPRHSRKALEHFRISRENKVITLRVKQAK